MERFGDMQSQSRRSENPVALDAARFSEPEKVGDWPIATEIHVAWHVRDQDTSGLVVLNVSFVARDPNRTLRAPRPELWYPPSNAMGRFNEAADPPKALAARAERPRVLAGLHDSTKWPGIPTS